MPPPSQRRWGAPPPQQSCSSTKRVVFQHYPWLHLSVSNQPANCCSLSATRRRRAQRPLPSPQLAAAQHALVLAQQEASSPAHQEALADMCMRGGGDAATHCASTATTLARSFCQRRRRSRSGLRSRAWWTPSCCATCPAASRPAASRPAASHPTPTRRRCWCSAVQAAEAQAAADDAAAAVHEAAEEPRARAETAASTRT